MSRRLLVLSTVGDAEAAEEIARDVVGKGLAACVNIIPEIRSIYSWKGRIESDAERLLLIKTTSERFEALRATIVERHPYEVPEVIALPIERGHAPYLEWLDTVCAQAGPEAGGGQPPD